MTGTVIRIRPRGVQVQMSAPGLPAGKFSVVSKSTGATLGTVSLRGQPAATIANFNWIAPPRGKPSVGDTLQPSA